MKTENKGRDYYREQQKKYKEMNKNSGSWLHISKLAPRQVLGKVENPLTKGKTYIKPKEEKSE